MKMSSIWQRVRWLFMAFQDSVRYHLSLTGRPGSLIAQLFIKSFLKSFSNIFSFLIFAYLGIKGVLFANLGFDSIQWAYSIGLWITFFIISRVLYNRIRIGWMLSVDSFFRLNRHTGLKAAFSEGKEYTKFWNSASKNAAMSPKGVDRQLLGNVEFYRLLIGYSESATNSWYNDTLQSYFVEMKQRIRGRRDSIFYTSIIFLYFYVVTAFFPVLDIFQQNPFQLFASVSFNATNMLALSSCLAAVYAFFEIRQLGAQKIHLQAFCLRIAEQNIRAAEEHRDSILSLDRDTRFSLAGTLKGPLSMDFYLLLFPALLGVFLYFFTDFFAQLFTILLFFLLPSLFRNIDISRLFLKMRIVGQGETTNSMVLMKLVFLFLELLLLCLIVSFTLPYFSMVPNVNNLVTFYFSNDLRLILPMIIFLFAIILLGWCKNASISQREAHEYSFVLIMFTAGLGFAVLKGYFVAFIYSLPALGLVCLRLITKMRRGY